MDWSDLLAVQGTLKSLLQQHSSKASILWHSVFFILQISHLYMTARKTIALSRQRFVGKVMSLLFNMLSRLLTFSSKEQASFNFMAAVTICSDFGAQENTICQCFPLFPIYLPWSDGAGCHDLHFLNVEFKASFFTLLFHLIKRVFSSSLLSTIRMVSSAYLRLFWFQLLNLPAWHFTWCTLHTS